MKSNDRFGFMVICSDIGKWNIVKANRGNGLVSSCDYVKYRVGQQLGSASNADVLVKNNQTGLDPV